jgi:1-phosphofructokinase family hexose kinase
MAKRPVLVLGLAPALQRTLVMDRFLVNEVNRARESTLSAAGKAVNVGLALARLGEAAEIAGFNGGATGRLLAGDVRARGATPAFSAMPASTRVCTTVIDRSRGTHTELVEEAPDPGPAAWRRFRSANLRRAARARLLVIVGTLPPGVSADFYAPFAAAAAARGIPVAVDSHRAGLLGVLPLRPFLAKLNVRELEATAGRRCRGLRQVVRAAAALRSAGAQWVLVTDGPRPACLLGPDRRAWSFDPPRVGRAVNPIGSGDCVMAGILAGWLRGKPMPAAVRFGLGCGTANVLTLRPADFDPRQAARLARQCRCRRVVLRQSAARQS